MLLLAAVVAAAAVVVAAAAGAGSGSGSGSGSDTRAASFTPEVVIPAGTYTLGTKDVLFRADAEGPEYTFTLPAPLFMDAFEVSNAHVAEWVEATGARTEAEVFGSSFVHENANIAAAVLEATTSAVAAAPWWIQV